MAKKRKKPTTRRRRRVSGFGNSPVIELLGGALAGFVGARMLTKNLMPNMDAKIKGAIVGAAGVFGVPMLLKGNLGTGLALGVGLAGGEQVLQSLGVIAGPKVIYIDPSRQLQNGISQQVAGRNTGNGISEMVNGPRRSSMRRFEGC